MTDELHLPGEAEASADASDPLHRALRQALVPPTLPGGFRSRLMIAIEHDQLADLQARRQALSLEYERQRQQLHADYLRLRRNQLALIVASAFAAGVCVSLLLPWLYSLVDSVAHVSLPLVTLVVVLALAAGAWLQRFGKTDLPGLSDG
ncbi:MAG: hypothetical protein WCH35_12580 [Comamonadaceae bacterium]